MADRNDINPTLQEGKTLKPKPRHRWLRRIGFTLLILVAVGIIARLMMPAWLRWYVNRTLAKSPLYVGEIGAIDVNLWKGGYSIHDVRINKVTGNVPVPFFAASRVDLQLDWDAIFAGKVVGQIILTRAEVNFVDSKQASNSQTGEAGPWLEIIRDLFPFKINSARIRDSAIHFRAFDKSPPVDVYLSHLDGQILNLTNIHEETTPLVTTVDAHGTAMDQAKFEFKMKLDPFSYHPTFQLGVRLLELDVTKTNDLMKAYGKFDFKSGFFDLVLEMNSREGQLEGYIKPIFRHVKVFAIEDIGKEDPLTLFWEALVGGMKNLLKNQAKDQFATVIPLTGDLSAPGSDIFQTIGNVLYNAFVRAYLPRFEGVAKDVNGLDFGTATDAEPEANPIGELEHK